MAGEAISFLSGVLRGLGDARQSVRDAEGQKAQQTALQQARDAALAGRSVTPARLHSERPATDYAASIGAAAQARTYQQIWDMGSVTHKRDPAAVGASNKESAP